MDEKLDTVLPGLTLDFLATGKNEAPQDVTLAGRRYRVYGTVLRGSDSRLGVLYFTDLTELYQVRDEYIRSRPVISIILIDNYEEMPQNLTESAISKLNSNLRSGTWSEPRRTSSPCWRISTRSSVLRALPPLCPSVWVWTGWTLKRVIALPPWESRWP